MLWPLSNVSHVLTIRFVEMMSVTFGLLTQVNVSGPCYPFVSFCFHS